MKDKINEIVKDFSSESHGSSDYSADTIFIRGINDQQFVPLSFLTKSIPELDSVGELQKFGYVYSSLTYLDIPDFDEWFQKSFNKKLTQKLKKEVSIVHLPDTKQIFEAVEIVDQVYHILKDHKVLVNGKNLPVQLGEWYAKTVLGLKQVKSSSQRGFDFFFGDGKKVEVKIHWMDATSPKGVKVKKSLVEMSDYTVVMYVAKNFMIRDILLLDSDFVLRKFSGKGHTIFLKDQDVSGYFFSRSDKHYQKIRNKSDLLRFATPTLAMKLSEKMSES